MPDVDIMEHIDSEGKFTDSFREQVSAIAGEDFKGSKIFDDVPDIATLVKNYAYTKRDYGKKLEGVIKLPNDKSTDQERAEFRKAVLKSLGAPESADDYDFPKPDDLPDGMLYDEDTEKEFRQFFLDEGIPADTVRRLVEKFTAMQIARFQSHLEEENKKFEEDCKSLKNDWKGNYLSLNAKVAFAALMEFGTLDLTKLLRDSKIYETSGDLKKWNDLGISPVQLRLWYNIGSKMKSSEHITSEGEPKGTELTGDKKVLSTIYDHPTSQKELLKTRT